MGKRGPKPGPQKVARRLWLTQEADAALQEYSARSGLPLCRVVDEWSRLVKDRDDLVAELRRVEDEARGKQQGYLEEIRVRKRAHDRLLVEVEKLRARRVKAAPPQVSSEYQEKMRIRVLKDAAKGMRCSRAGCDLAWMDLDAGHHVCSSCRRDLVQQLLQDAATVEA